MFSRSLSNAVSFITEVVITLTITLFLFIIEPYNSYYYYIYIFNIIFNILLCI